MTPECPLCPPILCFLKLFSKNWLLCYFSWTGPNGHISPSETAVLKQLCVLVISPLSVFVFYIFPHIWGEPFLVLHYLYPILVLIWLRFLLLGVPPFFPVQILSLLVSFLFPFAPFGSVFQYLSSHACFLFPFMLPYCPVFYVFVWQWSIWLCLPLECSVSVPWAHVDLVLIVVPEVVLGSFLPDLLSLFYVSFLVFIDNVHQFPFY